jgi:hypothetical protein
MGGTAAMRAAGERFMPRHKAEEDATYKARLHSTTLFNAFKDTVLKQTGKMFAKPIAPNDDVPETLELLCENIDGQGRALTPFAMDVAQNAMVDGIAYILVEFPQLSDGDKLVTYADQKAAGARPYWVMLTADQILGWRTEERGGAQRLTQLRFKEVVTEADGTYGERSVERIRVLTPGAYEVWERIKDNTTQARYQLVQEGTTTTSEITLVPVYTNRTGFLEAAPPLSSLAELNEEHWVSSSENRHALTFLRFAMIAFEGFSQEEVNTVVVGPDKGIAVPSGGSVSYVEHTGKGIEAGFSDIDRIEKRMETAGMTVRIEGAGSVTATTSAINSAESNAALKAIAKGLEDSIAMALQHTADMLKLPSGGTVTVYDGFADNAPVGTVDEMLKLRATNNISRATLWDILKQRAILPEDFDADAEEVRLEADVQTDMGPPPVAPFGGTPFQKQVPEQTQ